MDTAKKQDDNIEKLLLILIIFTTIIQFSTWGYQSVIYVLSTMFSVDTSATPIDMVIGIIAMIASGLLFAGSAMWWKKNTQAFSYMTNGAIIFMVKNVLDIINDILVFSNEYEDVVIGIREVETLAAQLGEQFFQLAFWVFIFFYFKYKITDRANIQAVIRPSTGTTI